MSEFGGGTQPEEQQLETPHTPDRDVSPELRELVKREYGRDFGLLAAEDVLEHRRRGASSEDMRERDNFLYGEAQRWAWTEEFNAGMKVGEVFMDMRIPGDHWHSPETRHGPEGLREFNLQYGRQIAEALLEEPGDKSVVSRQEALQYADFAVHAKQLRYENMLSRNPSIVYDLPSPERYAAAQRKYGYRLFAENLLGDINDYENYRLISRALTGLEVPDLGQSPAYQRVTRQEIRLASYIVGDWVDSYQLDGLSRYYAAREQARSSVPSNEAETP